MRIAPNIAGMTFSHWSVISFAKKYDFWNCKCSCGAERVVLGLNLRKGRSTNCGCARPTGAASSNFKHGKHATYLHSAWRAMKSRCFDKNNLSYKDYGGRGITVCERWKNDFSAFETDVGERPSPRHSIDRYPDNNGNYEPGNVRWATPKEQVANRRNTIREVQE